jgi:hypothetical protein
MTHVMRKRRSRRHSRPNIEVFIVDGEDEEGTLLEGQWTREWR